MQPSRDRGSSKRSPTFAFEPRVDGRILLVSLTKRPPRRRIPVGTGGDREFCEAILVRHPHPARLEDKGGGGRVWTQGLHPRVLRCANCTGCGANASGLHGGRMASADKKRAIPVASRPIHAAHHWFGCRIAEPRLKAPMRSQAQGQTHECCPEGWQTSIDLPRLDRLRPDAAELCPNGTMVGRGQQDPGVWPWLSLRVTPQRWKSPWPRRTIAMRVQFSTAAGPSRRPDARPCSGTMLQPRIVRHDAISPWPASQRWLKVAGSNRFRGAGAATGSRIKLQEAEARGVVLSPSVVWSPRPSPISLEVNGSRFVREFCLQRGDIRKSQTFKCLESPASRWVFAATNLLLKSKSKFASNYYLSNSIASGSRSVR